MGAAARASSVTAVTISKMVAPSVFAAGEPALEAALQEAEDEASELVLEFRTGVAGSSEETTRSRTGMFTSFDPELHLGSEHKTISS